MEAAPGAFDRIVEWSRALQDVAAVKAVPFRWGTALLDPRTPRVWDANFLRVEHDDPDLSAAGLAEEAERILAPEGLQHRKVEVSSGPAGVRLSPGFESLGWEILRLLVMVSVRPPQGTAVVADIREVPGSALHEVRARMYLAEPMIADEATARQMLERQTALEEVVIQRHFAAVVDDEVAAYCLLNSYGRIAEIDDVATVDEYRRRGLSRALVTHALEEAVATGHDLLFLLADEDDWPQEFYGRLGFEAVGRIFDFIRRG